MELEKCLNRATYLILRKMEENMKLKDAIDYFYKSTNTLALWNIKIHCRQDISTLRHRILGKYFPITLIIFFLLWYYSRLPALTASKGFLNQFDFFLVALFLHSILLLVLVLFFFILLFHYYLRRPR